MTIPIEIIHTLLAGLMKPILIRLPIILSDTLIKPFYSGLFNAFMYVVMDNKKNDIFQHVLSIVLVYRLVFFYGIQVN